jgi:hypothetical protein
MIVWFLLSPGGRSIVDMHDAALKFARCIDGHNNEIAAIVRDSGDVTSYSDAEYNQYRAKIKMQEIQAACLEKSGFKALVLRQLDSTAMTDSDKASIKRELTDAQTFDDLELIEKRIKLSEQRR